MNISAIAPAFADPIHDTQQTFRRLLDALSHPGRMIALGSVPDAPYPLGGALAAIALTVLDHDSTVWLDIAMATEDVRRYLHFHAGAPCSDDPGRAAFALIGAPERMPALDRYAAGDPFHPDRSATLVLQLPSLTDGAEIILSGPGIEETATIRPAGLPVWFWPSWNANAARYPIGVDIFLADSSSVIGLPRTTKAII